MIYSLKTAREERQAIEDEFNNAVAEKKRLSEKIKTKFGTDAASIKTSTIAMAQKANEFVTNLHLNYIETIYQDYKDRISESNNKQQELENIVN